MMPSPFACSTVGTRRAPGLYHAQKSGDFRHRKFCKTYGPERPLLRILYRRHFSELPSDHFFSWKNRDLDQSSCVFWPHRPCPLWSLSWDGAGAAFGLCRLGDGSKRVGFSGASFGADRLDLRRPDPWNWLGLDLVTPLGSSGVFADSAISFPPKTPVLGLGGNRLDCG